MYPGEYVCRIPSGTGICGVSHRLGHKNVLFKRFLNVG